MKSAEGRGRTLDEAVDAALIELQESRRNVDVKILTETNEETVVEVTVIDQSAPATTTAVAPNGKAETARNGPYGVAILTWKACSNTWVCARRSASARARIR